MQHHRTTSAILLAALITLGAGPAVAAGEGETNEGSASQSQQSQQSQVSDQKLQQFTLALADVRDIRMEYGPRLQQAETREEQRELKKEGREAMMKAIRDNGLELKEYNRIGNRLGSDKELQKRVKEMMASQQG